MLPGLNNVISSVVEDQQKNKRSLINVWKEERYIYVVNDMRLCARIIYSNEAEKEKGKKNTTEPNRSETKQPKQLQDRMTQP